MTTYTVDGWRPAARCVLQHIESGDEQLTATAFLEGPGRLDDELPQEGGGGASTSEDQALASG